MPTRATGTVQLPKSPLERIDLALVLDLLALRQFERLQHHFHFLQSRLQLFDDAVDLVDRVADR